MTEYYLYNNNNNIIIIKKINFKSKIIIYIYDRI